MKKVLAIILALAMIAGMSVTAMASDVEPLPEAQEGYSVFVFYSGLSTGSAGIGVKHHEQLLEPFYVIPENENTVRDGYDFAGFYCEETGKTYQIGESIPLDDAMLKNGSYEITLEARFEEIIDISDPDVTYTDVDRYFAAVNILSPEDYEITIKTYEDVFESLDDAYCGTAEQIRQLQKSYYLTYSPRGYRSLLTGNVFELGDTFDLDKLPAPEYVGKELEKVDSKNANVVSNYEITDYLVPLFNYYGATGAYLDPIFECTVDYYIPGTIATSGDAGEGLRYVDSETFTASMADFDYPVTLTFAPEYEGFVFVGYGTLNDTEAAYADNELYLDDENVVNHGDGKLVYAVKLIYCEDENYNPSEPEPEEPGISASLTLADGTIGANFYVDLDAFEGTEKVIITYSDPLNETPTLKTDVITDFAAFKTADGFYKFTVDTAAAQMTEDITVTICGENDSVLYEKTTTVAEILETYIEVYEDDANLVALCENMLIYGGYSQIYFDYKTDKPANANCSASLGEVSFEEVESFVNEENDLNKEDGFAYKAMAFSCRNKSIMRYAFTAPKGANIADYSVRIIEGAKNLSVEIVKSGSQFVVNVTDIAAAQLCSGYVIGIYCGDTEVYELTSSPMAYVRAVLSSNSASAELVNLVKALYHYGAAADRYFG